jgi:hypothetical protein
MFLSIYRTIIWIVSTVTRLVSGSIIPISFFSLIIFFIFLHLLLPVFLFSISLPLNNIRELISFVVLVWLSIPFVVVSFDPSLSSSSFGDHHLRHFRIVLVIVIDFVVGRSTVVEYFVIRLLVRYFFSILVKYVEFE